MENLKTRFSCHSSVVEAKRRVPGIQIEIMDYGSFFGTLDERRVFEKRETNQSNLHKGGT